MSSPFSPYFSLYFSRHSPVIPFIYRIAPCQHLTRHSPKAATFLFTNAAPLLRQQPSTSAPFSYIVHLKAPPVLAYEGGTSGFPATATAADVTAINSDSSDHPDTQSVTTTSGRRVPGQRLRQFADISTAAARGYANHLRAKHKGVAARVGVALGDIFYR